MTTVTATTETKALTEHKPLGVSDHLYSLQKMVTQIFQRAIEGTKHFFHSFSEGIKHYFSTFKTESMRFFSSKEESTPTLKIEIPQASLSDRVEKKPLFRSEEKAVEKKEPQETEDDSLQGVSSLFFIAEQEAEKEDQSRESAAKIIQNNYRKHLMFREEPLEKSLDKEVGVQNNSLVLPLVILSSVVAAATLTYSRITAVSE